MASRSKLSLAECISLNILSAELSSAFENKSILILPYRYSTHKKDYISFPKNTERLYKFLKEKLPSNFSIDICANDDKFSEYAEHFNIITLGSFFINSIALPVFIDLISNYIYNNYITHKKFGNNQPYLREPSIEFDLEVIQDHEGNVSKIIKYKGSVEGLNSILDSNLFE